MDQDVRTAKTNVVWAAVINLIVAAWLIGAPQVLGYADSTRALLNDYGVGFVIGVIAVLRMRRPAGHPLLSGVNLALAAWLLVAPFALEGGRIGAEIGSDLVCAVIVAIEATISFTFGRRAADGLPHGV